MTGLIRLAIVDDASRYSFYTGEAVSDLLDQGEMGSLVFYLPKSELFGKTIASKLPFVNSKAVWSSFLYPFQICRRAIVDKINVAHIQFEFNTFGHPATLTFFPLLLAALRAAKIKVVITVHAVPPRFSIASDPPRIARVPKTIVSTALICLYRLINIVSSGLIVHSEVFKNWLVNYGVPANKISVIPHGVVLKSPHINDNLRLNYWVRKTWGKRVVLCFGVISPRKGLEVLINAYQAVNKDYPDSILVLAGFEPTYFHGYRKDDQTALELTKGNLEAIVFPNNSDLGR